jgi:hypothetical protein
MEDIIYLIALIAWVAFVFYRKSQKKAEAAKKVQPGPPRDISSPFPSMKDIFDEEPFVEAEPVPEAKPATTDGMAPQLKETAFELEYKQSGIRSVEEVDNQYFLKNIEHSDLQEDESQDEIYRIKDWRARFDLRQAVIYSEILNRPYV